MEINLDIKYDEMTRDGSRAADGLRRQIFTMYPNAIWERHGEGHRIIV